MISMPTVKPLPLSYVALYESSDDFQRCEHLKRDEVMALANYSAGLTFKEALMLAGIPPDTSAPAIEEAKQLYEKYVVLGKWCAVNNIFLEDPAAYLDWCDRNVS
jgi:hypothetical protein